MKYFSELRKEIFARYLNGSEFRITNPGPLHAPAAKISVRRNKNLDIILESILEEGAVSNHVGRRPGEVSMITGTAELKSPGGMTATTTGISPLGTNLEWHEEARAYTQVERASLNTIEIDTHSGLPQTYLVEWFLSRPDCTVWPRASKTGTEIDHNLIIGGEGGLDIRLKANAGIATSFDTVALNVEGHRVYLRQVRRRKSDKRRTSCMLIYCDETTPQFRTKLQECISLTLGIHLVYLGNTGFSQSWNVTGMRAVRGYSINNQVFDLPPQPPSPLSTKGYLFLDEARFNIHVNALCANYDKLHLGHLSWAYWHAMCAPAHMAAAHYGAIIESLRAAYVASSPELRGGKIITDQSKWRGVAAGLNGALDVAGLDNEALGLLRKKISNLNSLSAGPLMELVCAKIGIKLGEPEKAAWGRRNDAAHGARISSDEFVQVVRDTKLLNIVLNRMLIAMTNASESYVDRYSLDHPIRNISEPVSG